MSPSSSSPQSGDAAQSPSRSRVFDQAADQRVEKFTESISFDKRLYAHDIRGSIAHARMLASVGILTGDEAEQIATTLTAIGTRIENGQMEYRNSLEDIHMH
ncbi:MAG: hypothetical protein KDB27_29915, partial [Planctomycetales bacterium]|nr:hypothetical protein [Planctomycetales bacterium]